MTQPHKRLKSIEAGTNCLPEGISPPTLIPDSVAETAKRKAKRLIRVIESSEEAPERIMARNELVDVLDMLETHQFFKRQCHVLEWGRYYFPHKFDVDFCDPLHYDLVKYACHPLTSFMAPRGHAKTTISCFLNLIFLALNHPEKYRHYLNVQATQQKAIAVNLSIRHELETNEELIRDYGDQMTRERWNQNQFVLKNGVIFTAIGVGQSTRGLNYLNKRPDYVLIDDLYDDEDISSNESRKKKEAWVWSTLFKARAVGRIAPMHIRGTAIHQNDLMHQLASSERWLSKKYMACDFDTGSVLWPQAHTIESLASDREEMGSLIFSREMLNDPWDEESSIIYTHWIHEVAELPEVEFMATIMAVDPADKEKKNNDYTGKAVAYVTQDRNVYIVHLEQQKMTQARNVESVVHLHEEYSTHTALVETNKGYGLFSELRDKTSVPVKEVIATKSKNARLMGVQSFFENGKVFFLSSKIDKKTMEEVKQQLVQLNPDHDDMRDAVVMILEHVREYRKRAIY